MTAQEHHDTEHDSRAMPHSGSAPQAPASEQATLVDGTPERVSLMTGDRICIHCSYNLIGQPIMREPHYNLLIVRCPECGEVTTTQEYPVLGKWAGRIGTVFAGLWMLIIIALLALTALMMFGLSLGTTELAIDGYWRYLNDQHNQWSAANPTPAVGMTSFEAWYISQDQSQLLADAGGVFGSLSREFLVPLAATVLLVPVVGAMWSVILIARRMRSLVVFAITMWLIALAFGSMSMIDAMTTDPTWAGRAAWQQVGVPILAVFITLTLPCLILGMAFGRALARWMVKVLLPPRMWCRMAWLWTTCNLDPPDRTGFISQTRPR